MPHRDISVIQLPDTDSAQGIRDRFRIKSADDTTTDSGLTTSSSQKKKTFALLVRLRLGAAQQAPGSTVPVVIL